MARLAGAPATAAPRRALRREGLSESRKLPRGARPRLGLPVRTARSGRPRRLRVPAVAPADRFLVRPARQCPRALNAIDGFSKLRAGQLATDPITGVRSAPFPGGLG